MSEHEVGRSVEDGAGVVPGLGNQPKSQKMDRQTGDRGRVYLTTAEAAGYLRKSVSWLLRQHDIPFVPGNPNTYSRADLDDWFERSKLKPMVV